MVASGIRLQDRAPATSTATTQAAAISVRDYGAKGDGVTNDTSAIQSALSAAGALGRRVDVVLSGTHVLTGTLTVPAKVRLINGDMTFSGTATYQNGAVVLDGIDASVERCTITILSTGVYLNAVKHRGSRTATRFCVISQDGTALTRPTGLDYNAAAHTVYVPSLTTGNYSGIVIEGNDVTLTNVHYGDGIHMSKCVESRIIDNSVHDITFNWGAMAEEKQFWAIYAAYGCPGILIARNRVTNVRSGGIHTRTDGSDAVPADRDADYGRRIIDNVISGCGYTGLAVNATRGAVVRGNHISLCNLPVSLGTGGFEARGTIFEGNHISQVDLTRGAADSTLISGYTPFINSSGGGLKIVGNTFGQRGSAVTGIAGTNVDGMVIEGNTFESGRPRVCVNVPSTVTSVIFRGNLIFDTDDTSASTSCVQLNGDDCIVEGNRITHIIAGTSSQNGLRLAGLRPLVTGNRITAGRSVNIVAGGNNATIVNNDFTGSGATTQIANAATGVIIRGNISYVTEARGVASVANTGTITHGLATTPTKYGATATIAGRVVAITAVSTTALTIALQDNAGTAVTVAENVAWWAEV